MNKTLITLLFFCLFLNSANGQTPVSALKPAPSRTVFEYALGEPLKRIETSCYNVRKASAHRYLYLCEVDGGPVDERGFYKDNNIVINDPKATGLVNMDEPYILAKIINGRLESLSWWTEGIINADDMMLSLKDKFGKPTSYRETPFDVIHNRITATWKFSDLEISFESIFNSMDEGYILIQTPIGAKHDAEEKLKPKKLLYKM